MGKRLGGGILGIIALLLLAGSAVRSETSHPPNLDELAAAKMDVARRAFAAVEVKMKAPPDRSGRPASAESLVTWSRLWMEAQLDLCRTRPERMAAIETHVQRLEKWHELLKARVEEPSVDGQDADLVQYYLLDAKMDLARARLEN